MTDDFKAPCYKCSNRRVVKIDKDDKLYCEQCRPDLFEGMFCGEEIPDILKGFYNGSDKV